jgi:hypothetical protein
MATRPHSTQALSSITGSWGFQLKVATYQTLVQPGLATFKRKIRSKTVKSRTDWVLCMSQNELQHKTKLQWTDHSDHCIVFSVIKIPNRRPEATHIRLPNPEVALAICQVAQENSDTAAGFLATHRQLTHKQWHMKRTRISLRQK